MLLWVSMALVSQSCFAQLNNPQFFPIAVWLQNPNQAQAYKDAGINMYIGLWNELDPTQLAKLKNAGIYVICEQTAFGLSTAGDTTIAGWLHGDEPDNAQWNSTTQKWDPCVDPGDIISYYNTLKSNDPSRPVYLNLGRGVADIRWNGRGTCTGAYEMYIEELNGYIGGCDIVSFDIYPVNSSDAATKEKLWFVPKGIDSLRSWSSTPKPVWTWIETTKINGSSNRKPTPEEVKAEVWMAIIHGASGIGYFCHSWTPTFDEAALLHDSTMINNVAALNRTISSLAPVLNSQSTTNYTSVNSSNAAVPVDFMTKQYGNDHYLFAVAMRNDTTSATFTVPAGSTIEVLGENRTITESGGRFTDSFFNYEVHIYKVTAVASGITALRENAEIVIFPNPATGLVQISVPARVSDDAIITVYNSLGIAVLRSRNSQVIDLSGCAPGMYVVCVSSDQHELKQKVLLLP